MTYPLAYPDREGECHKAPTVEARSSMGKF